MKKKDNKNDFADLLNAFNDISEWNGPFTMSLFVQRPCLLKRPLSVSFHRRIGRDKPIFMVNLRARN